MTGVEGISCVVITYVEAAVAVAAQVSTSKNEITSSSYACRLVNSNQGTFTVAQHALTHGSSMLLCQ
jgi:hypothetical protein